MRGGIFIMKEREDQTAYYQRINAAYKPWDDGSARIYQDLAFALFHKFKDSDKGLAERISAEFKNVFGFELDISGTDAKLLEYLEKGFPFLADSPWENNIHSTIRSMTRFYLDERDFLSKRGWFHENKDMPITPPDHIE